MITTMINMNYFGVFYQNIDGRILHDIQIDVK